MAEWFNGQNVAVIIFFIGLAGVIMRKNMMMTVIAIGVMNVAVILAFVTMNASVYDSAPMVAHNVTEAADPLPQALMITSVVIGVAVRAMMLVLILNIYRARGTLDWAQAKLIREGRDDVVVPVGFAEPVSIMRTIADRWRALSGDEAGD
jgi:multicomponent Na+:H+ antiporter subunit C